MAVYGNLASMPVSELLQWLGGNGKNGLVRLEWEGVATKLYFEAGRVVACISNDPRHLLGQFLLFRGTITQADLRDAMAVQDSTGRSLPDILVQSGALSSAKLEAEVVAKAQETILALFEWSDATFWYRESMNAEDKAVRVDLEVQGLLLEGMKRLDELAELARVFRDPGMIPRRADEQASPDSFDDAAERVIYDAINGSRTLAQIQILAHGTKFQVYRRMHRLLEIGIVQIDEHEMRSTESTAELFPFEPAGERAETEKEDDSAAIPQQEDPAPEAELHRAPPAELESEVEAEPEREVDHAYEIDMEFEELGPKDLELEMHSAEEAGVQEDTVVDAEPVEPPPLETLTLDEDFAGPDSSETAVLEVAPAEPPAAEAPVLEVEPPATDLPELEHEPTGSLALDEIILDDEVAGSTAVESTADRASSPVEQDFDEVHAAVETHLQIAREQLSRSEPEAALDQLAQASEVGPGHPSIGAMRAQSEAAMLQRFLREGLRPERRPVVVATREQLEKAETSPAQDYLLGLADGTWDIRSILSVSPLRPLEVMKALSGLLMRGLIELRKPISTSGARMGGESAAR